MIGLVGGVGSGKSHLARLLRDNHPIEIVEGDPAGHQVLTEPHIKDRLRKSFGSAVFTPAGEVDRRQLGRLVFGSAPEQLAARKQLEQIVHPQIAEILARQVALACSHPQVEAVLLDAALLLEAGWRDLCDVVVFIDTPLEQRVERVKNSRGWSRDELQRREASQFSVERKRKEAQYVVDNSGEVHDAQRQLESIYSRVVASVHS